MSINNNIVEHLVSLADKLDEDGNVICANSIDNVLQNKSFTKVAQYVGVIGYVLKQERAISNCIRKNRVSSNESMQDVVLGCIKDYQVGLNYSDDNGWSEKYAQIVSDNTDMFEDLSTCLSEILSEENKIDTHLENLKTAQKLLEESNTFDSEINNLITEYNDLINKLAQKKTLHINNKTAQSNPKRNFWSRFFSPSWSEKGQDKDTQFEMKKLIESLSSAISNAEKIKRDINNMKHVAVSSGLTDNNISSSLLRINYNDWNQVVIMCNKLNPVIESLKENPPIYQSMSSLYSSVLNNVKSIYSDMSQAMSFMQSLRSRKPITGRGSSEGSNESPMQYFAELQLAVNKMNSNPMDSRTHYYTQLAYSKLNDRLRSNTPKENQELQRWMHDYDSPYDFESLREKADIPSEKTTETKGNDGNYVSQAADILKKVLNKDQLNQLVESLQKSSLSDKPGNYDNLNELISILSDGSNIGINSQSGSSNITDPKQQFVTNAPEQATATIPFHEQDWDTIEEFDKTKTSFLNVRKHLNKISEIVENMNPEISDILLDVIDKYDRDEVVFPSVSNIIIENSS